MIRGYGWTLQLTETSFGYSTAPNVKAGVLDVLREKERRRKEVERELERIREKWPDFYN